MGIEVVFLMYFFPGSITPDLFTKVPAAEHFIFATKLANGHGPITRLPTTSCGEHLLERAVRPSQPAGRPPGLACVRPTFRLKTVKFELEYF
jgi:hypothetical protein